MGENKRRYNTIQFVWSFRRPVKPTDKIFTPLLEVN